MKNKRTIFWTLMTGDKEQRETHKSNWVWYVDGLGTKLEWKKEILGKMWTSKRVPLFKKGIYGTISLGELVKAFGTPDDKKQWRKTLESIGALGLNVALETPRTELGTAEAKLKPAQPQPTTASSKENHQ